MSEPTGPTVKARYAPVTQMTSLELPYGVAVFIPDEVAARYSELELTGDEVRLADVRTLIHQLYYEAQRLGR